MHDLLLLVHKIQVFKELVFILATGSLWPYSITCRAGKRCRLVGSSSNHEFTLEQLSLICPCVPVFGAMLPILIMAVVKALLNAAGFDAKFQTVLSVVSLLNSTWSDCRSPFCDMRLV